MEGNAFGAAGTPLAPWQGSTPSPIRHDGVALRAWRWMPAAALGVVCACCYSAVLTLVLLPTISYAAPFGDAAALRGVSPGTGCCILAVYTALVIAALVSFVTTSRMPPGHIPLWLYSREPGDQAYFHNVLQAVEKKLDGSLRFCRKCGAFKPDLAHHSRELGLCILCYQHWCMWSNNAIGFYNHKPYLLSLLYSSLAHATSLALLLPGALRAWPAFDPPAALVALWEGGDGSILAYAYLTCLASASIGAGSAAWLLFHAALVARGVTAHTFFRQWGCSRQKPPKPPLAGRPFDFGPRGNLARTCGRHPLLWLLPTNQGVEGNGIFFELSGGGDGDPWSRYPGS